MFTYSIKIEPQIEGGFTVTVPSLPGCISEGETLEEAVENIKDAIKGYLIVMRKHNREIPLEMDNFSKVSFNSKELEYA
ncbi:MAG: type II toxin-antitoxin system HicB family antitoxin [Candidatus Gracilibacteria bacterium]|nr:type II toxin-antitoxin system HicB family antitoxin [Candidatus Gracilibacteria bacterium]